MYWRWLGIDEPPERGECFVELVAYLKAQGKLAADAPTDEITDRLIAVSQRPATPRPGSTGRRRCL